jgi:hypothetical protein
MKICKTCRTEKPYSEFHTNGIYRPTGKVKYHPNCRACDKILRDLKALPKIEAIRERTGWRCSVCGYDKCRSALELHHVDASTKEFEVTKLLYNNSPIETLLKELDKCVMLCANCHREEHERLRGF